MDKLKYPTIVIILIMVLSLTGLSMKVDARPLAATSPTLVYLTNYSVLGGAAVTNTGTTTTSGAVGVSPGTSITGGVLNAGGGLHPNDASAIAAQNEVTNVTTGIWGALDQGCDYSYPSVTDLSNINIGLGVGILTPGVYCSAGSFILTKTLNLTGSDTYIFKTVSTLITSPGSSVTGGDPCNVWWRIGSSVTLDTTTAFIGNIFALNGVNAMNVGATLNGRLLTLAAGTVTLQSNTISAPICAAQLTQTAVAATLTAVRTNTATRTPTNTATRTPTSTPTSIPTSTPRPGVLPGTGFSPNGVTVLSNQSADKAYTAMGDLWLEVPKLGVQMNIVGVPETGGTWDVSWLGKQAGWLNGSAFPTWAGNSVLTGHVWNADNTVGPFRYINTLWWGDKVIVHAWGAKYVYEVRSVIQVGPGNTTAMMKHETIPWVTLVTCRGYDQASDSYKYRVLVRAVLIEVIALK